MYVTVIILVCESCSTICDPWAVAHNTPLSMGFPRQEYWSRLPFPSPGDLPNTGMELKCLQHWQTYSLPLSHQGSHIYTCICVCVCAFIQIAEKREVKGKGEEERYTHLNAEFQRLAREISLSQGSTQRNRGKQ